MGTLDEVQPWGSPGALGQPPLRIRSKRAQRVFCSIAPSRRAQGGGGGGSVREEWEGGRAKLGRAKGETDGLGAPLAEKRCEDVGV